MLATGASAEAITIAAQSFGLAQSVTTIAANSRLFQVPPTTVFDMYRKLSSRFRKEIIKSHTSTNGNGMKIDNAPKAYAAMAEYLMLCMPIRLETEIESALTRASAELSVEGVNLETTFNNKY